MRISRRKLLRRMSAGAAVAATAPSLGSAWPSPGARRPDGPIRLNRNENAYGPSTKVIDAMRTAALDAANRYPDVESEALRKTIAGLHGVALEQVVLGCGSGEIMRMAVDAFVGSRKTLITALPTFELIGSCAQFSGADLVSVPLTREYSHDLVAMLARCDAATGLVYICNPNNPTGTLTRRQEIEAFLRKLPADAHVLIDEAYHHYAGESSDYASFIDHPVDDSRVIVARSFSKIHGLAGIRVGYAVAGAQTARRLASYRLHDGVNAIAARAATTALDDPGHVRASATRNTDARQEFFNQANARMLRVVDSHTNFAMLNTERPSVDIVRHFRTNNVLVAPVVPPLDTHIRVSLGTSAEMLEFWRVWDLMPVHKMSM